MANYEDYLPGGSKDPAKAGLDGQIDVADDQQTARDRDPDTGRFVSSTPDGGVDWEERYRQLEIHNSQQAQALGTYKKLVDEYITSPTPTAQPNVEEEAQPITVEDFYDDPASAINRAVDAHPAVQEARQVVADTKRKELEGQVTDFQTRHPDYQQIGGSPEFQSWIAENPLRVDLYRKADAYDFTAADALFSLYKAEKGISQMQQEASQAQQIEAASLEASSELMVQEPPRYSRSEYVNKLMRAKQGDLEAEEWVKRNAAGYRQALAVGNVRD